MRRLMSGDSPIFLFSIFVLSPFYKGNERREIYRALVERVIVRRVEKELDTSIYLIHNRER